MSGDDRRHQLIEVAIDLFSRKGFSGTTTKEIAAAAGVTEAMIFRHFATKQDFYKAILDYKCAAPSAKDWLAEAQVFMDSDDDAGLFRFIVSKIVAFDRDETKFARLLVHAALEGHELAIMHHNQLAMPIGEKFKAYIARRQQAGAIRGDDPGTVILALAGIAQYYATQKYVYHNGNLPYDDEKVIEGMLNILLEGLVRNNEASGLRPRSGRTSARRKLTLASLATTLLLAISACAPKQTVQAVSPEATKPVTVHTAQAETRQVPASFEETGTFIADEISDIAPPVAGRILSTPVDIGAQVKQGQIICELDHRDAQLKLDQARAQLAEATATVRQAESRIGIRGAGSRPAVGSAGEVLSDVFDPAKVPEVAGALANYQSAQASAKMAAADAQRYANLVATGDVSKSAYEKARTQQETADAQANAARQQYEAAANGARQQYEMISTSQATLDSVKAQLAQAEKGLADTTIRAPFDGYITARPVAAGEYVALTNKIATIVRIGTLKLDLQTPEQRAAIAHLGDKVTARVAAYPDRDFVGKVIAINQSVDPNSRIFILEARFDNPDMALKPGMFANARVLQPGSMPAVFVPRQAVVRDKTTDSNQSFAISDGKARLRVVQIGETAGDYVRVISGIAAGETVALDKQNELYDGAPVSCGVGGSACPGEQSSPVRTPVSAR
jgi:multidrug efflux pump subunit AcrA (membrane-fusion protein)/AcrR family transcriptional regulator